MGVICRFLGFLATFLTMASSVDVAYACEGCAMNWIEGDNMAIRGWVFISVCWFFVQTAFCLRDYHGMNGILRKWSIVLWASGVLFAFTAGRDTWYGFWPLTLCIFPMVFAVLVLILGKAWNVPRRLVVRTLVTAGAAMAAYVASRAYVEWIVSHYVPGMAIP